MFPSIAVLRTIVASAAVMSLLACGGGGGGGSPSAAASGNSAPVIGGSPPAAARVGEAYTFQPSTSDADGDNLRFSAANLPRWAGLDAGNGRVTGTPAAGDEGVYAGISITVNDGHASATLPSFSIAVTQSAMGSATVSWLPPTENTDGTPLTDLSGYRIDYGRDAADLDQSIAIDNPALTSYVVEQLSAGTWYFVVVALNRQSVESSPSQVASKTVG